MASPKSIAFKNSLAALAKGKRIFILALPSVVWFTALSLKHPETAGLVNDWCYFVYWLFFLLAGFIGITQPKLMDSLERNRRFALTIAFLSLLLVNYLRWNKIDPVYGDNPFTPFGYASLALRPIIAWSLVFALVGYGKKYLNRKLSILDYLNQAVYPFYILHQTVIVVLVYYIVDAPNESILSKYMFTVSVTFIITVGIYHLLIRPYALTRFLFGMKPKADKNAVMLANTKKLNEVVKLSA